MSLDGFDTILFAISSYTTILGSIQQQTTEQKFNSPFTSIVFIQKSQNKIHAQRGKGGRER